MCVSVAFWMYYRLPVPYSVCGQLGWFLGRISGKGKSRRPDRNPQDRAKSGLETRLGLLASTEDRAWTDWRTPSDIPVLEIRDGWRAINPTMRLYHSVNDRWHGKSDGDRKGFTTWRALTSLIQLPRSSLRSGIFG